MDPMRHFPTNLPTAKHRLSMESIRNIWTSGHSNEQKVVLASRIRTNGRFLFPWGFLYIQRHQATASTNVFVQENTKPTNHFNPGKSWKASSKHILPIGCVWKIHVLGHGLPCHFMSFPDFINYHPIYLNGYIISLNQNHTLLEGAPTTLLNKYATMRSSHLRSGRTPFSASRNPSHPISLWAQSHCASAKNDPYDVRRSRAPAVLPEFRCFQAILK